MPIKQIIAFFLAEKHLPNNATLIDVRSKLEVTRGSISESINIPINQFEESNETLQSINKENPIIVYCAAGGRAIRAKKHLEKMGYTNVVNGGSVQNVSKKLGKPIL